MGSLNYLQRTPSEPQVPILEEELHLSKPVNVRSLALNETSELQRLLLEPKERSAEPVLILLQ